MQLLHFGMDQRFALFKEHGVLILPEFAAAQFRPQDEGVVMIRINDHFFIPLNHGEMFDDVLEVTFADIDQPNSYDLMMTEPQAKRMVDFMEKYKDKKLVVHCQAGISRSSATACAWAFLHDDRDLEEKIRTSQLFYPNAHVYRLLVNEIANRRGD